MLVGGKAAEIDDEAGDFITRFGFWRWAIVLVSGWRDGRRWVGQGSWGVYTWAVYSGISGRVGGGFWGGAGFWVVTWRWDWKVRNGPWIGLIWGRTLFGWQLGLRHFAGEFFVVLRRGICCFGNA